MRNTKMLKRNGMGNGPLSPGMKRALFKMEIERAKWAHSGGARVRTLADMSPEEVQAIEAKYGLPVVPR